MSKTILENTEELPVENYMPQVLLKASKDCKAIEFETAGCTQQITLRLNQEELIYLLEKITGEKK